MRTVGVKQNSKVICQTKVLHGAKANIGTGHLFKTVTFARHKDVKPVNFSTSFQF